MLKSIDLKMVLATLACLGVVGGMVMGKIQTVIGFADPLNEMVFTLMAFMMSIGCAMAIKK